MHLFQHSCSCSPYHVIAIGELECVFGKAIMFSILFDAFECFNKRYVNHRFHFACRNPVLKQDFLNCYKRSIKSFDAIVRYGTQAGPIIWSIVNAIPTSSAVSRKAVASNVPSLSTYLPPGKIFLPYATLGLNFAL